MCKSFKITGTTKEIYFACAAFMTFIFCGINRAYLAFLFHQLDGLESEIPLYDEQKSLLAAYSSLLSPLGCFIAGMSMDVIGRKYTLELVYLPFIISWALIACAKNVEMLYIAFLGLGVGVGMVISSVTYISEICTVQYRGSLLVVLAINYNFGVLLSNYLMYLLRWNIVAIIIVGIAVAILIVTHFLPESPIWLLSKGREEESIEILCRIRCKKITDLEPEIQDMKKYCASKEKISFMQTLRNCVKAWRQLLILFLLSVMAGNSGYVIMHIFGIIIVDRLDIPYDSGFIMIIYSIVGMISCLLTPYLLHKIATKKLLSTSSLVMSVCFLIVGLYQEFHEDLNMYAWIVPVSLCIYSLSTNFGIAPLAFFIPGVILPGESKGVLSGINGSFLFFYFSAVQKVFPGFLSTFGVVITLYTLSAGCFIIALYAIFILPETKGKTLNEIQEQYFKKKEVIVPKDCIM